MNKSTHYDCTMCIYEKRRSYDAPCAFCISDNTFKYIKFKEKGEDMNTNTRFIGCPRRLDTFRPCQHDKENDIGHWCDLGLSCFEGSEYTPLKAEKTNMEKMLEILGIGVNEPFNIINSLSSPYKFNDEYDLLNKYGNVANDGILLGILKGVYAIEKLPQEPTKYDKFMESMKNGKEVYIKNDDFEIGPFYLINFASSERSLMSRRPSIIDISLKGDSNIFEEE